MGVNRGDNIIKAINDKRKSMKSLKKCLYILVLPYLVVNVVLYFGTKAIYLGQVKNNFAKVKTLQLYISHT